MKINDLQEFWGNELRPVDLDPRIARQLSARTVQFLKRIGLPDGRRLVKEKRAFLEATIPLRSMVQNIERLAEDRSFRFTSTNLETLHVKGEAFISIGRKGMNHLGLKIGTGEVYLLDVSDLDQYSPLANPPVMFINAELELCLRSLVYESNIHSKMIQPIVVYNDSIGVSERKAEKNDASVTIHTLILDLENQLKAIDPRAFSEPNNYWQSHIMDLKHSWDML